MRKRIPSLVYCLLIAACAPSADSSLSQGGAAAQNAQDKLRCPSGTVLAHGRTMGVESTVWCERSNGVKHGPFLEWFENHQTKSTGEYVDGHRQGQWSFFFPNGQLESRITYDNGNAIATEQGTPLPNYSSPPITSPPQAAPAVGQAPPAPAAPPPK